MPSTALITGASAGIGKALAVYHAKQGGDVILSARRKEALDALKKELEVEYSIKAHVVTSDLSKAGAAEELWKEIQKRNLVVDILINNAGFGGHGTIVERAVEEDVSMIMVNIVSLVTLTHLFAGDIKKRGGTGKVLNVGSTAGFMPGPMQATYFATKAFVNSFSQAVDQELRDSGITSTVLCPGYVETEFAKVANLEGIELVKNGDTPERVAQIGYDAMMQKRLVVVNKWDLSFILQWVIPLLPRRMVLKMGQDAQTKK